MALPVCRDGWGQGNGFAGVPVLPGAGSIRAVRADRTEEGAHGVRLLPLSYQRNKI